MRERASGIVWILAAAISGCAADHQATGTPTVCPVHHVPLQPGIATIRYGLPGPDPMYDVRMREYPYAITWVGGGCMIGPDETEDVMYCPVCREVEAAALTPQRSAEPE